MIDQSHNIEPKLEAMLQSVLNCQEAYAKARQVLMEHAEAMHKIAEELLREETIPGEKVRAILKETQAVQRVSEDKA